MSTDQAEAQQTAEAGSIAILKKLADLYLETQLLRYIGTEVADGKVVAGDGPGTFGSAGAEIQRIALEVQELTRDAYEYLADHNHIDS